MESNAAVKPKTEQVISGLMLELGTPAHLKGYQYLRTAIGMCVGDMELIDSVTKLLYPDLAKRYLTTDQKIERAIRNAIEVSWERGNVVDVQAFCKSEKPERAHQSGTSGAFFGASGTVYLRGNLYRGEFGYSEHERYAQRRGGGVKGNEDTGSALAGRLLCR